MCNICGSRTPAPKCGCEPVKFCGCSTKLDSKCVIYDACALTPLGVIRGDNLEEIIKMINDMFADVYVGIDNAFVGMNIGTGAEVYKGQSENGVEEFRTFEKGTGILLIQDNDSIEVKVDTEWLNKYLRDFLNETWFRTHFQNLIKETWFKDYLKTIMLEPWFGELIKYWIKQPWFQSYLQELLSQAWFVTLLQSVLNQQWFINLLGQLFLQPWFSQLLNQLFQQQWFVSLLQQLLGQPWFVTLIQNLLNQPWFVTLLQNIFNGSTFQQWFANYIKNLFTSGEIDICQLIAGCDSGGGTPTTPTPTMSGEVIYNLANREQDFAAVTSDFSSKFSSTSGSTFKGIKIKSPDVVGLNKTLNTLILAADIPTMLYDALLQDAAYNKVFSIVAVDSNDLESNAINLTYSVAAKVEPVAPTMSGNVTYSLTNRQQDFAAITYDFTSKFNSTSGSTFAGIKITGPDVVGLNTTLNTLVTNIPGLLYDALDQDASYTKSFTFVAVDSNGLESNPVTLIYNVAAKLDNPPVTSPVTINLSNREDTTVTAAKLTYSDPDGHPIDGFRFFGAGVGTLFTDAARTVPYTANSVLSPGFTLYFKAPNQDPSASTVINYQVRANGLWSS